MSDLSDEAPALSRAVLERTAELAHRLLKIERSALEEPSLLPGWSRLTIACHLRYGAAALKRMTKAALRGEPTAYYPDGRAVQRPGTLVPRDGEGPVDVVASLAGESFWLDQAWRDLTKLQWSTEVVEPKGNVDLGPRGLDALVLLRLTEVEVHGTDLDVGLPDWSEVFVHTALPVRVQWLETRGRSPRATAPRSRVSWLLKPSEGAAHLVTLDDDVVKTEPADVDTKADATIEGTSRDLLALLLGRRARNRLRTRGSVEVATSFSRLFPGP
jgi:uncharacterized protein (TIGR03083 family)